MNTERENFVEAMIIRQVTARGRAYFPSWLLRNMLQATDEDDVKPWLVATCLRLGWHSHPHFQGWMVAAKEMD